MIKADRVASRLLLAISLLGIALLVARRPLIAPPPARSEVRSTVETVVRIPAERTSRRIRREFRQVDHPVWRLSLLELGFQSLPLSLAADSTRLFLASAAGSLLAVDQRTRRVVWTHTMSEQHVTPRRIVMIDSGNILLLSGAGEALLRLSRSKGEVTARWPAPSSMLLQSGCRFGRSLILLSAVDTGASLLFLDSAGALRKRASLPWPELLRAHPLQRQLASAYDPETRTCVLSLMAGHGFAILGPHQTLGIRSYAEHAPISPVVVRTTSGGRGEIVTESRLLGDATPVSEVAAGDGILFVPFAGRALSRGEIIDLFSLPNGSYRLTLQFSHELSRIAVVGRRLYAATYEAGIPVVLAYQVPVRH